MFLVGLTGGIATGKSSVAAIFRSMGVEVIDADLVAREVVEPGKKAWKRIRKEFGESVFYANGQLNRQALGKVIFAEPEKRRLINSITHPEIYKSIFFKEKIKDRNLFLLCLYHDQRSVKTPRAEGVTIEKLLQTEDEVAFALWENGDLASHQFVVIDLPLLYESAKMVKYLNKVVVVSCEPSRQLQRLMKRDSMRKEDALLRIKTQMPLEEKCRLADYVICNNEDEVRTENQVNTVINELRNSKAHWKFRVIFVGSVLLMGVSFGFAVQQIRKCL